MWQIILAIRALLICICEKNTDDKALRPINLPTWRRLQQNEVTSVRGFLVRMMSEMEKIKSRRYRILPARKVSFEPYL